MLSVLTLAKHRIASASILQAAAGQGRAGRSMLELVGRLLSIDLAVRKAAIQAAATSSDAEVIATLERLLRAAETGEVPRQEIAEALGRNPDPAALNVLVEGTRDPDPMIRGLSALGLGHVSSAQSVGLLIGLLSDAVNTVRNLAERSLLQLGPAVREHGVPALLDLLQNPVPLSRSPAARLLGLTQDPRALAPLTAMLQSDRQWLVRMWVAKGLGDLGDAAAFPFLADRLLHDDKNRVRAAAAEALGKLSHPDVASVLEQATDDSDGGVRQHVEEALAKLRRAQRGHDEPEEHHEPHFADDE